MLGDVEAGKRSSEDLGPTAVTGETRDRSRKVVGLGAVVALALAAGLVAWVLVDRDDEQETAAAPTQPAVTPTLPATPESVTTPAIRSVEELRQAAAGSPIPVYWAGRRGASRLELSQTSTGTVFVRYLPPGTSAGDLAPRLTVATYPRPNGFAEVRAASRKAGTRTIALTGGGLAVYDPQTPTNLHLAFPNEAFQVEVFGPTGRVALDLVESGAIRPVR